MLEEMVDHFAVLTMDVSKLEHIDLGIGDGYKNAQLGWIEMYDGDGQWWAIAQVDGKWKKYKR